MIVGTVVSTSCAQLKLNCCNLFVCRLINLLVKEIDLSRSLAPPLFAHGCNESEVIAVRIPDRKLSLLIMKNKNYTKCSQRLTLLTKAT